jgi:TRAP-type C4-dicarboxylate transport system permease small subunit
VKEQLKKVDEWVFRAERGFTVAALAVMSVVVFLDVVHRTFASQENKAVSAVVKVLGYGGVEVEVGDSTYQSLESVMPTITWIIFVALTFFAVRSANVRERVPPLRAFVYAVVGVVASYGLIRLFIKLLPNGLIWSQPLALVLTLWVGFIAASMCTYENKHLKVEAVTRAIPDRYKPFVVFASGAFTAGVCVALMWLSLRNIVYNYQEYTATDGQGGLFSGLDVPKYQCFLALPVAFFFMTLRFGTRALAALQGELPPEPQLEGLEDRGSPAKQKPSEVPTEVSGKDIRAQPIARGLPPSDVPTEVARIDAESDRPVAQSKVPTDPHEGARRPNAGTIRAVSNHDSDEEDA